MWRTAAILCVLLFSLAASNGYGMAPVSDSEAFLKQIEFHDDEIERRNLVLRDSEDDILSKGCKGLPADIAVVMDASRSIYPPDFKKQIKFVKNVVGIFEIASDKVRIAAFSFGSRIMAESEFGFKTYSTEEGVKKGISNIKFIPEAGSETRTALALKHLRNVIFANARKGVLRIAIILTDGVSKSKAKTAAEARLLKTVTNVTVLAIGVGKRVSQEELKAIASSQNHVFTVDSYGALAKLKDELATSVCYVPTSPPPPTTEPPKIQPCGGPVDINFVFDPSQLGSRGTAGVVDFIRTSIQQEDLQSDEIRVGAITGKCPDVTGFRLNKYRTKAKVLKHLDQYHLTELHPLLQDLRKNGFMQKNGGRRKARDVAVVFIAGKLVRPNLAVVEAKRAKRRKIEVYVVVVGSYNHESLIEQIASKSTPQRNYILRASDAIELRELGMEFVERVCKNEPGK